MSKYIYDLIEKGEGLNLDFKFEIADSRKIARSMVAFANTDGGKLLIGVKDNGKIAGVRSEEEYYMLDAAANLYCKPPLIFSVKKWNIEGRTVLEADIPPATDKPVLARNHDGRWLAYVRVNDRNVLVNAIQIRVWKNEKKKKGVFLKYTNKEKILMDYLEKNSIINIISFCKLADLSYRKASDILVKLVSLKILEIDYQDQGIYYKIKK